MNILIMDLGAEHREKTQYLQSLVSRLAALPQVNLLLASQRGSVLAETAAKYNVPALTCKPSKNGGLFFRLKLHWRLRKSTEPWIIQCYDEESFALAIRLARKKEHVNIVYSALRPEPLSSKSIIENIHLVSAVIAGTNEISRVMESSGFLPSSLFVIPGCLEPEKYLTRRERRDGRIVFACSDKLEAERGYEQILQALAYLYGYEEMPPWEVRIANDGPLFEEVLARARELHVESRLAIFGGFNAPEILRDCDVMLAPAEQNQGSSLTIKEGWAVGLPVICSDIESHREMINDGANGVYFQNNTPADLAEKMYSLATSQELREKLAGKGFLSLKDYSCAAMLERHLSLYQRILGEEQRIDSLDI